jgi:adenosylcobyric acid synthase
LRTIAIMAYPRISNLDEFQPLARVPGVQLRWVRRAADMPLLARSDWIILPGSKHTSGDLAWLRGQGLDAAVAAHAAQGGAVLGICGGLQMLGEALIDTHGIDGNAPGLGLLPLVTVFEPAKTLKRTQALFSNGVHGAWAPLAGLSVGGYEIHQGQTAWHPAFDASSAAEVLPGGLAWQSAAGGISGNVMGVYLHGLFEEASVLQALFGTSVPPFSAVFDGLADFINRHFDADVLEGLLRQG